MLSTPTDGTRILRPSSVRSRAVWTTPSAIRQTSVLVPPMSKVTASAMPRPRSRDWAAATPAAGPDMTIRSGCAAAVELAIIPPLDCTRWSGAPAAQPARARSSCST